MNRGFSVYIFYREVRRLFVAAYNFGCKNVVKSESLGFVIGSVLNRRNIAGKLDGYVVLCNVGHLCKQLERCWVYGT